MPPSARVTGSEHIDASCEPIEIVRIADDCRAHVNTDVDTGMPITGSSAWYPQIPEPDQDGRISCSLIWCPEVPQGTRFAFYRVQGEDTPDAIEDGILVESAPSLNLARLRQRGAELGAQAVVLILP